MGSSSRVCLSQRHISEVGHIALADVLSLYIRKEVCETQRRELLPAPPARKTGPWPSEQDAGKIPPLEVYTSVRPLLALFPWPRQR